MDTVTRRSAYVSTALHATLVALAFWPRGCGCSLVKTAPPVQAAAAAQAPKPTPARPATTDTTAPPQRRLVLAPSIMPPDPPLPKLAPGSLPPLPVEASHLITPANTDHAGDTAARGAGQSAQGHDRLPGMSANSADLIGQLAARKTSNAEMDRDGRMLKTTQEFIEFLLNTQIDKRWRHLTAHVTERRLVIEVSVAPPPSGTVTAHLLNSSGNQELDQAIEAWLRSPDLRLPPIRPDVRYPFLVIIRR